MLNEDECRSIGRLELNLVQTHLISEKAAESPVEIGGRTQTNLQRTLI